MAEEKKEAKKAVDVDKFIARKLKSINEMKNEAKAKKLANRVLNNKGGK